VLREIFNARKWHTGDLADVHVDIRHRGAPGDERTVYGADILEIRPGGLRVRVDPEVYDPELYEVSDDDLADGNAFIPYHRVLRVRARDGAVIWEKP
jgi:uncharacterized protein (UPF0248 family)